MNIQRIGTLSCRLGEGPVWDIAEQVLYFVDATACLIWRYDPASHEFASWTVPSTIGSFALRRNGGAIVALQTGFHLFDFATGVATPIANGPRDDARLRFNDGKADPRGRFLAGSMANNFTDPVGALYRVDTDLTVTELLDEVIIANGPSWSPDGKTFYFSDSGTRLVTAYDYDLDTGNLSNPRVFADMTSWDGVPDGATVDADGRYWVAMCGGGKIACLNPDGSLDRTIDMPEAVMVSSMSFGGPRLDRLYVTTIGEAPAGYDAGANGGALFMIEGLGVIGKPEYRFAG